MINWNALIPKVMITFIFLAIIILEAFNHVQTDYTKELLLYINAMLGNELYAKWRDNSKK